LCPFRFLPKFNIVWDITMDIMHTLPRTWKGHLFPMMRGDRLPPRPKARAKWTNTQNNELFQAHKASVDLMKEWIVPKVLLS
jgi:hypothetical protein